MKRPSLQLVSAFIVLIFVHGTKEDSVNDLLKKDQYLENFIARLNPNDVRTDIVFLMDESGSLTRNSNHFNVQKKFVEMIVQFFVIKPENTRLSLLTFANYARVQADYINNLKGDICNFLSKLRGVNFKGGFTNTQEALSIAGKVLSESKAARKYVVMLSDGCKNLGKDPLQTATDLKRAGIEIFGVVLGKSCSGELKRILTSSSHVYTVKNVKLIEELLSELKTTKSNKFLIPQTKNDYCDKLCKNGKNCCDANGQCGCDSGGDYKCVCQPGTTGSGYAGKCFRCPRGTYSEMGKTKCQNCPLNSNTSFEGAASVKACKCNPGYHGFPERNQPCKFRKCPKLRPPVGGVLVPPYCGRELNDSCAFWCKHPYCPHNGTTINCLEENGRKLQEPRFCMENRAWSGPGMKCEEATCLDPPKLKNAHYECDSSNNKVGSKCSIKCDPGFSINEGKDVYIECAVNGTWLGLNAFPACKRGKCPPLNVDFKVKTQPNKCTKLPQTVGTKCMLFCTNGYKLRSNSATNIITCDKNANWDHHMNANITCQDEYGPTITCPPFISVYSDPLKKSTQVTWTQPTTADNDNYPPIVKSMNSSMTSPHFFEIGEHTLVYKAEDVNGLSSTCEFTISVIDTEPPVAKFCPEDQEVYATGKSVEIFWEIPEFWDNSGHYIIKSQTHKLGESVDTNKSYQVIYVASDSAENTAACQFDIHIKPYKCPYHPLPSNGAVACIDSPDGQECTATCNPGYEFVSQPEIIYSCVNDNGNYQWQQNGQLQTTLWPNCAEKTTPESGTLEGRLNFHTENCDDVSEEDLAAMENEIENKLKKESPICIAGQTCDLTMESSICVSGSGPAATVRRKRDATDTYIFSFSFLLKFDINNNFTEEITDKEIFPLSSNILDSFYNIVDSTANATLYSSITFACHPEHLPTLANDACLKCPLGTFFDTNTLTCTPCPLNTYQDIESSSNCKPCPVLHYTSQEGARNENQCKATCEIGEYSQTGLQQCMACPIGTYQNETGQVSCVTCSEGKTTWSVGAYSEHQCTTKCMTGHYSPTGFEPCLPCARGFYQSVEQSIKCVKCEDSLSTMDVGSSDATQCFATNPCKPNPCFNHGDCLNDNGKAKCQCFSGYFGARCDIEIDHCDINLSCLNGGTCVNNNASYTCNCPHGYSGSYCEEKTRNCFEDTCLNGGTCIDKGNSYHCECLDGFNGNNCEQNFDDCIPGACYNGGTCFDSGKPQSDNKFYCCCSEGYSGRFCDKPLECDSIHCENGGTCLYDKCLCKPGFKGELCEEKINYCSLRPCRNHGNCIYNQVNFTCECAPGYKGDLCEYKMPIDYDMIFSSQNASIYALINTTKDLYAFTISFWMKVQPSENEYFGTPISFSYLSPIDKRTQPAGLSFYDVKGLIVYLHGIELPTKTSGRSDANWHHYLMTWDSLDGAWSLYRDGEQVADGSKVGVGIPLWKGCMVIGQDQNTLGGGFRQIDSFKGILSQINLWDFAMALGEVKQLYRSCGYIGNVIGWPDFETNQPDRTFVTSSPSDLCSRLEKCGENVQECQCHHNNILNNTLCENRLKTCSPNPCQNKQPCKSLNNVSFCDCNNGYTGKFCHYDINECLIENGGCSHQCINYHGSYSCNCPKGFKLDEDGHTCKSLRQCLYKGLLYAEKEIWIDGCEKCDCLKGNVRCRFQKCSQIDCLPPYSLIRKPDDCCFSCFQHSAVCSITNQNVFTTFDGTVFAHTSDCQDILAQDCSQDRVSIQLRILKSPSIEKILVVRSECIVLELTFKGELSVNGELKKLPFQHDSHKLRVDFIKRDKSRNLPKLLITTNEGVSVSWYHNEEMNIHVPKEAFKQMCGLCGDYNGESSDDMKIRNYTVVDTLAEFVQDWKVETAACPSPVYNHPGLPTYGSRFGLCAKSDKHWKYASEKCEAIRNPSFHKCYDVLNPQESYDYCIKDACKCSENDLCYCDAVLKYVAECHKRNVHIDEWLGQDLCEKRCQNGTVFNDCGPACPETCEKQEENDPQCEIDTCRAGCHCPFHMVLHGHQCILPEDCPDTLQTLSEGN